MSFKRWLFLAICLPALACKQGVPDSELVAKVNGEGITKADFEASVERSLSRYRGQGHTLPPGIEQRIKESVLRRAIDDKVIAQKAKAEAINVTKEELEAKFQEHKKRFRTEQAFADYLKRSNNTEENMKKDLERNLLRDRVVEKLSGSIEVTDADVQKYYDENKQRFKEKEQIKASRILLRVAHTAKPAEQGKAKQEAKKLLMKVGKKSADFGEIAKEHSQGPEASRKGELGWLTRGRMPPEWDNVAFNLEPNQVSKVFASKLGLEIVKVWEKKPERQREVDEVKDNIKNSLTARKRNEKRREVLRDLKKNAKVEQLIKFERGPGAPPTAGNRPPLPGTGSPLNVKPPRPPQPTVKLPQKPQAPKADPATAK